MVRPAPLYRENPQRAVYVLGRIDEQNVYRVLPEITRLRGENVEPITVYIHSPGGSTWFAEEINAVLKAPTQDGKRCRVITVVTNYAGSAAADLLALGDYAIAYPAAIIHCHGTRQASDDLTSEKAALIADSLQRSNDAFALRLARKTFRRIVFHFANLRQEFPTIRADLRNELKRDMSDMECFAFALYDHLADNSGAQNLPKQAYFLQQRLEELSRYVFDRLGEIPEKEPVRETEAKILKHILDYELQRPDADKWNLSDGGIQDVVTDFTQFTDYMFGPHRNDLDAHISELGSLLLDDLGLRKYSELEKDNPAEASIWLKEQVKSVVEPLWYFVVALCRLLQQGEYQLAAADSYWLGIVDEVVGLELPSLRLFAENPDA